MGLRWGTSGDPKDDLRRERERLDKVRSEIGQRFEAVQRRERELERALAAAQAAGVPAAALDGSDADRSELVRQLEEKEFELARRERELAEREAALAQASPPEDPDARLAEIEARLAELGAAEALFTLTRRELEDRSVAVEAAEQKLRQREQALEDRDRPAFALPEAVVPQHPGEITDERGPGFSGGLLELQRRGLRRRSSSRTGSGRGGSTGETRSGSR